MAYSKSKKIARTYQDRIWEEVAEVATDLAKVSLDDIAHQYKKGRAADVYLELKELLKKLGI